MRRSRLNENTISGAVFVACGIIGLSLSRNLPVGSAAVMQSGYMPVLLSILLVLLGLITGLRRQLDGRQLERWGARSIICVVGSIGAFAALLAHFGLFFTSFCVVTIAGFGSPHLKKFEILVLAVISAAGVTALFVYALGLPVRPWPY